MNRCKASALFVPVAGLVAVVVYAASPQDLARRQPLGNSYYLYTGALKVSDAGVAQVPARFKWSVETSWSGIDLAGNDLPDQRVLLRLYDPDQNFTALTAQMDLATATKLHQELGDIIAKKQRNPSFQYRPKLYDPSMIPTKRITGVDATGTAIVEDVPAAAR